MSVIIPQFELDAAQQENEIQILREENLNLRADLAEQLERINELRDQLQRVIEGDRA